MTRDIINQVREMLERHFDVVEIASKLRNLGHEVFIDTYLSMMIKHLGNYAF